MLALGKGKNNRLVNPQIPNYTEHMLQPTCICGVASPVYQVTHSAVERKGKETRDENFYRAEDKQLKCHQRMNWRLVSPLDIAMFKMERERNCRLKPLHE